MSGAGGCKTHGLFVTLEGIEGSGKTTVAALVARSIAELGRSVVITAEPGGCKLGYQVRSILLDSTCPISDRAELLLFEAARAQHVETVIRPALEANSVIICDRYTDSSLAYQGYARGLDVEQVRQLNCYATGGLVPDATILLDLPVEAGLARQQKIDRISSEDLAFHSAVREGFLAIARAEPDRITIIDATQQLQTVQSQTEQVIINFLKGRLGDVKGE